MAVSLARKNFRQLIDAPGMVVAPGASSPLEARLAQQAGFKAAYMSGYAAACLRWGVPDVGLVGYGELEETVRAIRAVSEIPLIVDCDTAYGDVTNVRRTVQGMEALGAAAVQIEDQVWPKKCGHMAGKFVEPRDVAVRKIKAAVASRADQDLVIIARTDALGPHGMDEAMWRAKRSEEHTSELQSH